MRPIKFRAWDEEEKQMIYFGLHETDQGYHISSETAIDDLPTMQFTGLCDKNGKEETDVYAGDKIIIADGSSEVIGIVKMNDKTGQWVWIATEIEASALTVHEAREIPLWEVLDKQYRWKGCLIGTAYEGLESSEKSESEKHRAWRKQQIAVHKFNKQNENGHYD